MGKESKGIANTRMMLEYTIVTVVHAHILHPV